MKKGLMLWVLLFVIMFGGVASAVGDVAYIYRKQFKIDENIINIFNQMGMDVDLIDERTLPRDFSDYKMIFVGDENYLRENLIPVHDFPTVIANYYHMDFWGYTDEEGVSQIASNNPLNVLIGNQQIQVYTQSTVGQGGPSISYYYLDNNNEVPSLETVARAETTDPDDGGDVIAHASPGDQLFNGNVQHDKMCFFGIIASDYWTLKSENLFKECVQFVAAECTADADCPADINGELFCQNGNVVRDVASYSCVNGGLAECVESVGNVLVEDCDFGCSEGECLEVACANNSDCDDFDTTTDDVCNFPGTPDIFCTNNEINCFVNSDCGTNGLIGNLSCFQGDVAQDFRSFACNNPGTGDSFCSSNVSRQIIENCPGLCSEGVCIEVQCSQDSECEDQNPLTLDECINPNSRVSMCRNIPLNCGDDFDCGFTGFVGTEFCTEDNIVKNFQNATCHNNGTPDSFCTLNIESVTLNMCDAACVNGGCVICDEDSDCSDSKPDTLDKCINPQTIESFCTNQDVECFDDSDCGEEELFGDLFCVDLNLTQQFREFTCNNPGNADSFCTFEILSVVNQTCEDLCFEGACADVECFNNADCNDGNSSTEDVCVNAGTGNSNCMHNGIECFTEEDCGTNGFIENSFCSFGDVARNFINYNCNNAGTIESFCSSAVEKIIVEDCDFGCEGNICSAPVIECNENTDCGADGFVGNLFCSNNNVNRLFRTHTCENSGTQESECSSADEEQLVEICSDVCAQGDCIDVLCFENTDCGVDGFVGESYCSGDKIVQLFEEYECINDGTEESFCENDVSEEILENCEFGCGGSMCLASVCEDNTNCNDGNPLTFDQCVNAGTVVSRCVNTPIACGSQADCNTDRVIGITFCYGGDIYQNFQNFMCLNPGTTLSACIFNIESLLVDQCENACFDGNCIVCDEDFDCDDGNIGTRDICLMPQSIQSHCSNEAIEICQNECSSGAQQCFGDGFRSCGNFDVDSCFEWGSVTACDSNQTCTNGVCVDNLVCNNECVNGARQCFNDGFIVCGDGNGDGCTEWSPVLQCGSLEQCVNGFCI